MTMFKISDFKNQLRFEISKRLYKISKELWPPHYNHMFWALQEVMDACGSVL